MRKEEKIIATMLVRNEEDIIAECINHTFASGANHIILMNNNSTDATREIAASFYDVTIIDELSNEYKQGEWQSRMAHMAMDMGADWVVPVDADEFWDGIANLRQVPKNFGVALANALYNHPPTNIIKEPFHTSQMPYFEKESRNYGTWWCGRFAFRPYQGVKISMGQDSIIDNKMETGLLNSLWLHHYPIRSYQRYIKKIEIGVAALNAGRHNPSLGSHWRSAYEKIQNGTIREEYERKMLLVR